MFEKLLSVLPYTPGLMPQLAFYSRRMREEASIRRTGLVFLALAFFIQFFAVLVPPQSTVAASDNDMLYGGFNTRLEAKRRCLAGEKNYGTIMHYFGITCKDIGAADDLCIHENGQNYYSMGWKSVGQTYNGQDTNEHKYDIPDAGRLWMRKMDIWNQPSRCDGNGTGWHVLRVPSSQNKTFYVMFDCGNLVSVGLPSKAPTPAPETPDTPTPTPQPTVTPDTPVTPPDTPPDIPPPIIPLPPPPLPPVTPLCPYNNAIPKDSSLCYLPCEYNGSIAADSSSCKPCDQSVNGSDTIACVSVHKTASNITAGITDANNTTASAGDVITYTLYAQNNGKATVKEFTFQENMSDVLDYADITDAHGGTLAVNKTIAWPTEQIKPGQTATRQVTVKVKAPIPQTPVSSSDPSHFDMIMTNVYGNSVNVKLPASPIKTVEVAAASLPNTGPGTTLFIAATIVIMAGYFYSRSGLLARESELAIKEAAV